MADTSAWTVTAMIYILAFMILASLVGSTVYRLLPKPKRHLEAETTSQQDDMKGVASEQPVSSTPQDQ